MIDPPGELSTNDRLSQWLNRMRRAILARTPRSTPDMELNQTDDGFIYRPKLIVSASESTSTGGRYLGPNSVEGVSGWSLANTRIYPWDFVSCFAFGLDGIGNPARAMWLFAWSDTGADTGGNGGPIFTLRTAGGPYLVPTAGSWMLLSYTPIDAGSQSIPNGTAVQQLIDCYPEQ